MAEQDARKPNDNSEHDWDPIGRLTLRHLNCPLEDVEMMNDEPVQSEVSMARLSPTNPTSREKQEHEDSGHGVYSNGCAASVECRGSELLAEEEDRERTTPSVAYDYGFHDTGNCRHFVKSDVSRRYVWLDWSDMLRTKSDSSETTRT